MGVNVKSENHEFATGYFTFNNLRLEIAGLLGDEWYEHYRSGLLAPYDMIWSEYNALTEEMAKSLSREDDMVVDFLYQPDCEGSLDPDHCDALASLMDRTRDKWETSETSWAYGAHPKFTLSDFHDMLEDGRDSGEGIEWT